MKDSIATGNICWANAIVTSLLQGGVENFCLSPGSRSTPLTLAVARNPKAQTVMHFDERGMAFHALGLAKATEKVVVLIVTSGTAPAHLLPAIMEAYHDHIPLLILTADRPPELRDTGANQTTDQVKMYQNFVRYQVDLPCPDPTIPIRFLHTTIAQALAFANGEEKGPVHLNWMIRKPFFPIQNPPNKKNTTPVELLFGKQNLRCQEVASLADRWQEKPKGIFLLSRLPLQEKFSPLFELATRLQWPIFADISSPIRTYDHPNLITNYDLLLTLLADDIAFYPDIIVQFGDRFVSKALLHFLQKSAPSSYYHIAPYPKRYDPNHLISHRIHSDPLLLCQALKAALHPKREPSSWLLKWQEKSHSIREKTAVFFEAEDKQTQLSLFYSLSNYLKQDRALFIANSTPIRYADRFFYPKPYHSPIFCNRGLSGIEGNIGTVTGIAKGIKKAVLAILGDLACLHDINSFAMAKKSKYPILWLIINNDGGAIFSKLPIATQKDVFTPFFQTPHGITFEKAAALFGLEYANFDCSSEMASLFQTPNTKQMLVELTLHEEEDRKAEKELLAILREEKSSSYAGAL